MVSSIEIAGLILIIVGIVYTFLKALGLFQGKAGEEGEIESKMFTLKGGPGIILVGLGVLLLIIGYVGAEKSILSLPSTTPEPTSLPAIQRTATDTPALTQIKTPPQPASSPTIQPAATVQELPAYAITINVYDSKTNNFVRGASVYLDGSYEGVTDSYGVKDIPEVSQGSHVVEISKSGYESASQRVAVHSNNEVKIYIASASQPTVQPTFTTPSPVVITLDYLIGTWTASDASTTLTFTFNSDGSYQSSTISGGYAVDSYGVYALTDSRLMYTNYVTGVTGYISLIYVDENTITMDNVIFRRT